MADFIIRNLQYEEIPLLVSLPRLEGREMGLEPEIKSWLEIDPHGIFIAVADGQIAGCCCGIALSADHGYIGMFVVGQRFRGVGLGRILWNAAITRLGDRNISLSSADKMLPFYRDKAGFTVAADWTVDLYCTTNVRLPAEHLLQSFPVVISVDPFGPLVHCVMKYDSAIHKYDRSRIVKALIAESGTMTIMSIKENVECTTSGYACMKKSMQGHWLIAPVYADDYASAYSLIYGLLDSLNEKQRQEGVVAKLIGSNCSASKLFLQFGMKKTSYQLKRLFTKEVFPIPEEKIFALQSSVFCTE